MAMCKGISKQKVWDAGGVVSTGRVDRKQLMSLMSKIVDPVVGKKLRIHSKMRPAARPIGQCLSHWVDNVHEHDGGDDLFGGRLRNGVEVMRQHMDALYKSNGMPEAWDDMNGVFLDPAKVAVAREEDEFLPEAGRIQTCAEEQSEGNGGQNGERQMA